MDDNFIFVNDVGPRDGLQNQTIDVSPETRVKLIEKLLDEISFTATDRAGEKIIINKEYINKNLDKLVKDTDLSKFIL